MNTEKKVTAVEFYAEGLENLQYNPLEKNGYDNAKQRLLEKAIAMAEDENHKAYLKGHEAGFMKAFERQLEQHKFNNEVQGEQIINEQDGLSPINI